MAPPKIPRRTRATSTADNAFPMPSSHTEHPSKVVKLKVSSRLKKQVEEIVNKKTETTIRPEAVERFIEYTAHTDPPDSLPIVGHDEEVTSGEEPKKTGSLKEKDNEIALLRAQLADTISRLDHLELRAHQVSTNHLMTATTKKGRRMSPEGGPSKKKQKTGVNSQNPQQPSDVAEDNPANQIDANHQLPSKPAFPGGIAWRHGPAILAKQAKPIFKSKPTEAYKNESELYPFPYGDWYGCAPDNKDVQNRYLDGKGKWRELERQQGKIFEVSDDLRNQGRTHGRIVLIKPDNVPEAQRGNWVKAREVFGALDEKVLRHLKPGLVVSFGLVNDKNPGDEKVARAVKFIREGTPPPYEEAWEGEGTDVKKGQAKKPTASKIKTEGEEKQKRPRVKKAEGEPKRKYVRKAVKNEKPEESKDEQSVQNEIPKGAKGGKSVKAAKS